MSKVFAVNGDQPINLNDLNHNGINLNGINLNGINLNANADDSQIKIKPREKWGSKADFLLSLIGYSVGLGNVWRFPYLAGKHGGAAFLIPYVIMLLATAWPMFFMELNLGQFSGTAPQKIYKRMVPIFSGLGWAMVLIQLYTSIYYNMVLAWAIRFLGASLTSKLPWISCKEFWNTQNCLDDRTKEICEKNGTHYANGTCFDEEILRQWDPNFKLRLNEIYNETNAKSGPEEFLYRRILHLHESQGIHDLGFPQWELVLCLFIAWVLVFACIFRGIKSSGKVVYFTATFPYVILIILLVRGVTLEGARKGIEFYIIPNVSRLADGGAWGDAAQQVFFSLSIGGGGLTTLASYNDFHDNTLRDTMIVVFGDSVTSLFAGFVIFSILGFIAHSLGKPVEAVARSGSGLAFVAYPDAVARMPVAPLWSFLFFFMLVILGIDSQMVFTEVVVASIIDKYPHLRRFRYKTMVIFSVCLGSFLLGLIMTTPGGPYVLNLLDNYAGGYPLVIAGLIEICMISYVYGLRRFIGDVQMMLGNPPNLFWRIVGYPVSNYFKITWAFITPAVIAASLIFKFITFERTEFYGYKYPTWADAIGWLITLSCVILVPLFAIYLTIKQLINKKPLKELIKPTDEWVSQATQYVPPKNHLELQQENGVQIISAKNHDKF